MQAIGPSLLSWGSKDLNIPKFGGAMHAVLVSELRLFDKEERGNRESHLQRIVTTYMVFTHLSMSAGASTEMQWSFILLGIDISHRAMQP
jgi:hypothetical protein